MSDVKCKYEVCTCSVPHDLCPHPLGWASEDEVRSLAERLCGTFDRFDGFPMEVAREALRWRDETRPVQVPPAAVPAGYDALRQFVNWAVGEVWQGRDISGGDAQDKARDLGLIDEVTVTEPCGDMCNCGDGGFPATCYRLGPVLAANKDNNNG